MKTSATAKKGVNRVAAARMDSNNKIVRAALEGELEGCEFARVTKHLGNGHVEMIDEKKRASIGVIRGLLRRKGLVPVTVGCVVIVSAREWESRAKPMYDIVGVTDAAGARGLGKAGRIPDWMTASGEVAAEEGAAGGAGVGFEFEDDEVDVDAI